MNFKKDPFSGSIPSELRPGVRLSPEATKSMAEQMVGKPITDADGVVIGRITKAWVEGGEVRFETDAC